ncbi:hypothetical protein [Acidisoma cladoniae]|uniref:hypothetical protein n=1 Tax=Acidisoma cladoniae TaxID=3040935 RepID=UPI00254B7EAC|nr:hypothetical protein [Acidisoma sp. PAMC 29798]
MSEMTVGKLTEGIDLFAGPKVAQQAPWTPIPTTPFSYAALDPSVASMARKAADDIRQSQKSFLADIGKALLAVKAGMTHGMFGAWLDAEFRMGARTAENYMNAAKFLEGKSETVSLLPPTAVYALAAKDADPIVVAEVLAEAEAGAVLSASVVRDRLAGATKARLAAAAVKSAEEVKREKENEKKRRQAQAARDKQREAESAAFDLRARANAQKAANHLITTYQRDRLAEFCDLMICTNWYAVQREIHALGSAELREDGQ